MKTKKTERGKKINKSTTFKARCQYSSLNNKKVNLKKISKDSEDLNTIKQLRYINLYESKGSPKAGSFSKDLNVHGSSRGFLDGSVGKESACNAGDWGDLGLILGSETSPGGGHDNP